MFVVNQLHLFLTCEHYLQTNSVKLFQLLLLINGQLIFRFFPCGVLLIIISSSLFPYGERNFHLFAFSNEQMNQFLNCIKTVFVYKRLKSHMVAELEV